MVKSRFCSILVEIIKKFFLFLNYLVHSFYWLLLSPANKFKFIFSSMILITIFKYLGADMMVENDARILVL